MQNWGKQTDLLSIAYVKLNTMCDVKREKKLAHAFSIFITV